MQTNFDLPLYRCHKQVRALKIGAIEHIDPSGAIITPENSRYARFHVDAEYVGKHKPEVGGYYVVYEDGYKSYSPAAAFESGYSLIERRYHDDIDRKYRIAAVNPVSGAAHSEADSVLFLAKDKALPNTLRAYFAECTALGAHSEHLESISLLIERVELYQKHIEAKVPDTNRPAEIKRCLGRAAA